MSINFRVRHRVAGFVLVAIFFHSGNATAAPVINSVLTSYSSTGVPTSVTIFGTGLCAANTCTARPAVTLGGTALTPVSGTVTGITAPLGVIADGDYVLKLTTTGTTSTSYNLTIRAKVAGTPGPQGPAGPAGPAGAQGPMGLQGPAGNNGVDGARGPAGVAGAAGATGPAGPQGLQGLKGDKGEKGDNGAQGPVGPAGAMPSATLAGTLLYWNGSAWTEIPPPVISNVGLRFCAGALVWSNDCTGTVATGWTRGSNGHYYTYVNAGSPLTFTEAKVRAAQMLPPAAGFSTHLVTITSSTEESEVANLVPPTGYSEWFGSGMGPWIGAYQRNSSSAFSEPTGGWGWITGEPFNFTQWRSGEPNNDQGIEDSAHLIKYTANSNVVEWNDLPNAVSPIAITGFVVEASPRSELTAHRPFFEDFNSGFDQTWTADIGAQHATGTYITREGSPNFSFGVDSGVTTALMTTHLAKRTGSYSIISADTVPTGTVTEVRFKTQGWGSLYIDGVLLVSLVSDADRSNFVATGIWGGCWGSCPVFLFYDKTALQTSPIPYLDAYGNVRINISSDTWYRLRITDATSGIILSLLDDASGNVVATQVLAYSLSQLGSSFHVQVSQMMGGPDRTNDLGILLDYVEVSKQ